ncbi:MAG TPA: ABC transporter substrate-binding protein [Candidatus Limnocylindria bacterium]|nr:ABC transporter substrate-binding protein [Candidatus Limnocylindria bacterium]
MIACRRPLASLLAAVVVLAACAPASQAPNPRTPAAGSGGAPPAPARAAVKINWTAQTGANSGLWAAFEAGYFKEENLDVELVNIPSSVRSVAALIGNEVQFGFVDGANVTQAVAQGGAVRMVFGITNHLVFSIMVAPSIKTPADLKGKRIGITTPGSSTHTAALQALKIWGLTDRDVALIPLTEVPNILAGMIANQVDGGSVSPPTNTRAKKAGFTELINLATSGPDYPSVAVAANTAFITTNPDVVTRVIRAYSRGVSRFRTDKPFGTQALGKYLKIDDQSVLDDTWEQFSKYLELPPYVKGTELVIQEAAATNAAAKNLKPEDIFDQRFVKQLEDQGFFKNLK